MPHVSIFEIPAKNAINNDLCLSSLQMITRFESLSATSRPVTNRRHEVLRLNNALREVGIISYSIGITLLGVPLFARF